MKLLLFSSLLLIQLTPSSEIGSSTDQPQVSIKTGSIKGKTVSFRGIKVNRFLGIPFGEPLTGLSRFQKPKPAKSWDGVLPAYEYGPKCIQPQLPVSRLKSIEDCFYLNVITPSSALIDYNIKNGTNKLRPVMVWIHGGGFNYGAANLPDSYDGTTLVALHDVIFVSINYRLSQFGFLYLPEHGVPGNMGFWDQRLALKWVQENIRYFGGDPDKVTVFGESAGSMSIAAHLVSTHSKGLFRSVIMQSGAIYDSTVITQKPSHSTQFLEVLNCTLPDEIQSCLSSYKLGENNLVDTMSFTPVIGDEFLPDSPQNIIAQHGVDPSVRVLLGTVGNEGASLMISVVDPVLFDPYHPGNLTMAKVKQLLSSDLPYINHGYSVDYFLEKYFTNVTDSDELRLKITKVYGDVLVACPTYIFGRDLVKNGHSNVFAYYQTQKPFRTIYPFTSTGSWLPATHADDIPFVFGESLKENGTFDKEETILSSIMMKAWTNFAKRGEPGSIGGQRWSPWKENDAKNFFNPTIELNSLRIGHFEPVQVNWCFDIWPFGLKSR